MGAEMPSRPLLIVAADVGRALMPAQAESLAAALAELDDPSDASHLVTMVPSCVPGQFTSSHNPQAASEYLDNCHV